MKQSPFGLSALLAASLMATGVGFGVSTISTAHARDSHADTVTVFVDATFGFRKDHMARQLNKSHAEYQDKGYRFAAMQAYVENGDLQGFFVTYTRN